MDKLMNFIKKNKRVGFVLKTSGIEAHTWASMLILATNFGDLPRDISESLRGEAYYVDIVYFRW